jgi:predicted ester cyclase
LADELVAADYVDHYGLPGFPPNREGLKQLWAMLRAAFPDLDYTLEDEIAEGDKVVHRVTARGTHKGAFLGVPSTGKQVAWSEMHMVRFAGGKVVEHWGQVDAFGLLQQLGAVPMPG